MKVVVMIPAFNEQKSIEYVINEIPKDLADEVDIVVIDDGSTDNTAAVAKKTGAKVIRHKVNKGLASAFRTGLEHALSLGADIIVNTDADGQYDGREIQKLLEPIISGRADVVIGSRFKGTIEDMPFQKRIGNRLATLVTKLISGYKVSDAQTGFRAFNREAAQQLCVQAKYTYVQETLVQVTNLGLVLEEVPILFRKRKVGSSRLISNIFKYALRAGPAILSTAFDYKLVIYTITVSCIFTLFGLLLTVLKFSSWLPFIIICFQAVLAIIFACVVTRGRRVEDEVMFRLKVIESQIKKPD